MIGIFARANHPLGYGFVERGETRGKAHGWVVIAVECADEAELKAVEDKLRHPGFEGIGDARAGGYGSGWMGEWYGGQFDLVGTAPSFTLANYRAGELRYRSFGDNRYGGIYTAEEVLR